MLGVRQGAHADPSGKGPRGPRTKTGAPSADKGCCPLLASTGSTPERRRRLKAISPSLLRESGASLCLGSGSSMQKALPGGRPGQVGHPLVRPRTLLVSVGPAACVQPRQDPAVAFALPPSFGHLEGAAVRHNAARAGADRPGAAVERSAPSCPAPVRVVVGARREDQKEVGRLSGHTSIMPCSVKGQRIVPAITHTYQRSFGVY